MLRITLKSIKFNIIENCVITTPSDMAHLHSSCRFVKKRSKMQLRIKVSQDPEDFYRLDAMKSAAENAYDIYAMLCLEETRDTKRLFLLNALASLCLSAASGSPHCHLQFNTEELLYCLSASLVHAFTQVRAAALRTIRYTLNTSKDVKTFNSLQLHHLLCRSIDLMLKNDDERVQALKLVRKMLAIAPDEISSVVVRCLVSLTESGIEESDNLLRACLATLAEFAVLNPGLLIICGGVTSITRNVLECHNPRIAESLCGVLLYLLEWPQTRNICGVRLDCLAAPYCDFTYRLGIMDKNKDARELRYTSCRLALLSVLRSWTGTLEFCDPSKPSGLKAIIDALYLNQTEIRRAILDLLYELLSVPQPGWTDDYDAALQSIDPSDFQDMWLLSNGFVSAEGRSILPSLATRTPNVVEQHLALLLYSFLETGLLNALVEVVVTGDQFLTVRATVLIGKIVHLMHTHLPADICSTSPALPTLVGHATQGNQQANAAVAALQNYQKMLRQRPASRSLFLDSIIQDGALMHTRLFDRDLNSHKQRYAQQLQDASFASSSAIDPPYRNTRTLGRHHLDSATSSDECTSQVSTSLRSSFKLKRKLLPQVFNVENFRSFNRLLAESNVLIQSDANAWDWEVVSTILKSSLIRNLDFTPGKLLNKFLKRLIDYFKPSNYQFSHQELVPGNILPPYVSAGLDLIDVLLNSNELECMRYITDFFSDISQNLLAVTTSSRAHDCLFSPQHMNNTMCQQYFLYIGRMCRNSKGIEVLKNTTVVEYLITLVRQTDHVCYVKLIVSGLNYSFETLPRQVLEKALTLAKTRSGRLYATQFMAVLLRARLPNFEVWGIPLIIQQTKDLNRSVVLAAIDVLEEACNDKYYLEEIVSLWPNLKQLGDEGRLLMTRFYSVSRGINSSQAHIEDEIAYWRNGFNKRYVLLIEADTHSSLTLHVRNEDGFYSRRNCNQKIQLSTPNIQSHLYGQLVQTSQGMTALRRYADLPKLIDILTRAKCNDEAECLELKAAIWALCHASTHQTGIEYFVELDSRIYEKLIMLVSNCEVYSIRATCFSALGLIAGTPTGANMLLKLNWLSVRHDRNTMWPVHQLEDCLSSQYTPLRHHFKDVSPYNYTSISDEINDAYYAENYWNMLLANHHQQLDINTTITSTTDSFRNNAEELISRSQIKGSVTGKSKTLPEGNTVREDKTERFLSESKTTDAISLLACGANTQVAGFCPMTYGNRIRYNSCTDSNTSGVSSCESVTGKNTTVALATGANISDFYQFPLSPIPSLSNLLELPTFHVKNLVRRPLFLGSSFLQTALNPLAMKGYAKLRSLRAYSRPVFFESSVDLHEFIDIVDRSEVRNRKYFCGESSRRLIKARSVDRQIMLSTLTRISPDELQRAGFNAPKLMSLNDQQGPCYVGICLPKNSLDLFPRRNFNRTYVSCDFVDQEAMDLNFSNTQTPLASYLTDSINNDGGDDSSVLSSLSDVSSSTSRRPAKCNKHSRNLCLHCIRSTRRQRHSQITDTHINNINGDTLANASLGRRSTGKGSDGVIPFVDVGYHSPEIIHNQDSLSNKMTTSIFYHVQRLANPVSAKQSKMALLELKQKHPQAFQDICLYSEACRSLGSSSYRMSARRFLQELFLDLNFNSFYVEPQIIIGTRKQPTEDQKEVSILPVSTLTTSTSTPASVPATSHSATTLLVHKVQLKTKPTVQLASVYETSWENLLMEQSPRLALRKTSLHVYASQIPIPESNTQIIPSTCEYRRVSTAPQAKIDQTSHTKNVAVGPQPTSRMSVTASSAHGPTVTTTSSFKENDNQKYTRGRFYTLELDLSCTKNKFPITDRSRPTYSSVKSSSLCIPQINANTGGLSILPGVENCTVLQFSNVTKSLSGSITKPEGVLNCKKRLQSSKSEALLSDGNCGSKCDDKWRPNLESE